MEASVAPPVPAQAVDGAAVVLAWVEALPDMVARCTDDVARVDLIAALETVKGAAAGGQAELTHAFRLSQIGAAKGRTQQRLHRSVCGQVGLARRESPHRGTRHVGLATSLHEYLPHTRAALNAGRITEWQATVICRETACLDPLLRQLVDQRLAAQLGQLGDRGLATAAAREVAEADAAALVARAGKAAKDRRISVRPAPDSMCYLTSLLPVAVGVAAYAALHAPATAMIATPAQAPTPASPSDTSPGSCSTIPPLDGPNAPDRARSKDCGQFGESGEGEHAVVMIVELGHLQ
jgi:hypothetical protein